MKLINYKIYRNRTAFPMWCAAIIFEAPSPQHLSVSLSPLSHPPTHLEIDVMAKRKRSKERRRVNKALKTRHKYVKSPCEFSRPLVKLQDLGGTGYVVNLSLSKILTRNGKSYSLAINLPYLKT